MPVFLGKGFPPLAHGARTERLPLQVCEQQGIIGHPTLAELQPELELFKTMRLQNGEISR